MSESDVSMQPPLNSAPHSGASTAGSSEPPGISPNAVENSSDDLAKTVSPQNAAPQADAEQVKPIESALAALHSDSKSGTPRPTKKEKSLTPLQLGVFTAGRHVVAILALTLGPSALQISRLWISQNRALVPEELFISSLMLLFADAWLMCACGMFAFELARREQPIVGRLIQRSLLLLPKVFLSYAILVVVLAASAVYPLLIAFSIFFFWAPVFVIGELFSKPIQFRDDDEETYIDEEGEVATRRKEYLFSGQSIISLGFGRSIGLVIAQMPLTIELLVLFISAKLIPAAVLRLLSGPFPAPLAQSVEVFSSNTLLGLLLVTAGTAFTALLPKQAREEVALGRADERVKLHRPWPFGSAIILFVLSPLTVLCWFYLQSSAVKQSDLPQEVVVTSVDTAREGETLIWRVRLEDTQYQFRWLEPEHFEVQYEVPKGPSKSTKQGPPVPTLPALFRVEPQLPTLEISRAYVFDENGKYLESYRPHIGALEVELRFWYPPQFSGDRELRLIYPSAGTESKPITTASVSSFKNREAR